jgi:hypothetical protein
MEKGRTNLRLKGLQARIGSNFTLLAKRTEMPMA